MREIVKELNNKKGENPVETISKFNTHKFFNNQNKQNLTNKILSEFYSDKICAEDALEKINGLGNIRREISLDELQMSKKQQKDLDAKLEQEKHDYIESKRDRYLMAVEKAVVEFSDFGVMLELSNYLEAIHEVALLDGFDLKDLTEIETKPSKTTNSVYIHYSLKPELTAMLSEYRGLYQGNPDFPFDLIPNKKLIKRLSDHGIAGGASSGVLNSDWFV